MRGWRERGVSMLLGQVRLIGGGSAGCLGCRRHVGIIDASPGVADSDGSQQTMAPEDAQLANLSYQK